MRLLRCRACRLKWFPKEGPAEACPACGGKEFGGTLELFHLGIALIALAPIGWMRPLLDERPAGDARVAASSSVAEKKPAAESQLGRALASIPAAIVPKKLSTDAQRGRPVSAIPAVITARRLTVAVERGPAEGQRVTFRRGQKVTILRREDRRFLVRDRRGNQAFVPTEKVLPKRSTRAKRRG
jgi:hypothetical protein